MLVMHEPMKTSSILAPATSLRNFASSGSFGQHRIGSLISRQVDLDHVRRTRRLVGFEQLGLASQACLALAMRRSSVRRVGL